MTRIGTKHIDPAADQGQITFYSGATAYMTMTPDGVVKFATAKDTNGVGIKGLTGGIASISAATAATAGSTSALSSFQIPHGLGSTPTIFDVQPGNLKAAGAELLGAWITADATNLYFNTASSVTAASAYNFNWTAAI